MEKILSEFETEKKITKSSILHLETFASGFKELNDWVKYFFISNAFKPAIFVILEKDISFLKIFSQIVQYWTAGWIGLREKIDFL